MNQIEAMRRVRHHQLVFLTIAVASGVPIMASWFGRRKDGEPRKKPIDLDKIEQNVERQQEEVNVLRRQVEFITGRDPLEGQVQQ